MKTTFAVTGLAMAWLTLPGVMPQAQAGVWSTLVNPPPDYVDHLLLLSWGGVISWGGVTHNIGSNDNIWPIERVKPQLGSTKQRRSGRDPVFKTRPNSLHSFE